jgi:hypothetical protein
MIRNVQVAGYTLCVMRSVTRPGLATTATKQRLGNPDI